MLNAYFNFCNAVFFFCNLRLEESAECRINGQVYDTLHTSIKAFLTLDTLYTIPQEEVTLQEGLLAEATEPGDEHQLGLLPDW